MKIIMLTAIWCPACLIMDRRVREIIKQYPDWALLQIDIDEDEPMANHYQVDKTLPVFIVEDQNGNILRRVIGELSINQFKKEVLHVE